MEWLEFLAFLLTCTQLVMIERARWPSDYARTWLVCMAACVVWLLVAWSRGMLWLGVQNVLIFGWAVYAFTTSRNK